jgi:hypothetical protein
MIVMPAATKDPNELHKAVQHDEFKPNLQALLDSAEPLPEPEAKKGKSSSKKSGDSDNESDLDILIRLGTDGVELFHDPDGEGYAVVPVKGHRENWPIRAEGFELWLRQIFYQETSRATNKETLQAGLNQLAAIARFDGPEREVFVRIAETEDAIFVDLCDSSWRAVKVTADGWQVVDSPEVRFRRSKGMLPLPEPILGGSVNEFRGFINAQDDDSWHLILGWLIQAYRPKGPYPLLVIQGEQGTAKSTLARLVRSLVDPGKPPYRTPPRSEHDLSIAATNSWVISMDNLSGLQDWLSDALCRLSTGGGFGTRQLYANSDEVIFDAKRPAILNGIDDIAERQDLNDRALIVRLRSIQDSQRKTEAQLVAEFELARPRIFGALLSALSVAIRNQHSVKLTTMSRMADFLEWVTAAEPGLGVEAGAIAESYRRFRKEAVVDSLEFDEVATALQGFMENRADWTGTCTELLKELREFVDAEVSKTKGWPQLPNKLSERITRVASFLRAAGIDVDHTRVGKASKRIVVIRKMVVGTAGTVGIVNPVGATAARSEPSTTDDQADSTQEIQNETVGDEKAA